MITGKKPPAYDVFARNLQREVVESEKEQLNQGQDQYNQKEVNQAIVHTRADMVLVFAYLRWGTGLMKSIKIAIWIIVVLLTIFVGAYIFK
jgi:hypothetical protein